MFLHVNVIEVHHANNVEVDHVQGKDLAVIDTEMIEDASDIWKLWWNVPDSVQSVPIIIGQPFLNRAGVTMVMRDGKIRLFERHLAALPDIDNLPSPRVTVYSKDDCVIPANTVGYIEVCCPDHVIGDVFIEGSTRQRPGQEYNIPSCITSVKNGVIAVRNTSPTDVHFAKKQLLIRGTVCSPASTTETGLADIMTQVGSNLNDQQCNQLLTLLNDFRECFAVNTTELGYQPRQANDSFLSNEVCEVETTDDLAAARCQASEKIIRSQEKQKTVYDKRRIPTPKYEVGQQVLIRKVIPSNDGKSRKLLQKYSGPYEIVKILDKDRLVVKDLPGTTRSRRPFEGIVSTDKVKPYIDDMNDSEETGSDESSNTLDDK
ncbi:hypothetical protein NQ318_008812 [Aromia moschata]|uniref:Polyprotein n=1 Tax=Aromia moschata TaxID=1265417 RepID=A0AAV8ZC11_9CUCU|nr:hypothetical protein NQ318_008812 [Aromia moschata]